MRYFMFVTAAALSLAIAGAAVAERAHVKQQEQLAFRGGYHPQAYTDQHANEKVAGSARTPSASNSASDAVSDPVGRSVGSAGAVTIPSHVDYDLPPESVAGSSEP